MAVRVIHDEYALLGILARPITPGEEYDLVSEYLEYRTQHFTETDRPNLAIFVEPHIHGSYPDILFVEYDPATFDDWTEKRAILTTYDLKLFQSIYSRKQITLSYLSKIHSISNPRTFHASFYRLEGAQMIERSEKSLRASTKIGITRLQAVEAKLHDMTGVLNQAVRNSTFATESLILTQGVKGPRRVTIEQAASLGIGIHYVHNNAFAELLAPRRRPHPLTWKAIQINEHIGKILSTHP